MTHTFVLREVLALRERGGRRRDSHGAKDRGQRRHLRCRPRRGGKAPTRSFPPRRGTLIRAHLGGLPALTRRLPPHPGRALAGCAARSQADHMATLLLRRGHAALGTGSTVAACGTFTPITRTSAADLAMIATRFRNRLASPVRPGASPSTGRLSSPTPPGTSLPIKVARADAVIAISDYARDQLMELARCHETVASGSFTAALTSRLRVSACRPASRRPAAAAADRRQAVVAQGHEIRPLERSRCCVTGASASS